MEIENLDSKKTRKRIAEIKPEIMELDAKSLKKLYVDTLIKMHCITNEMHCNLMFDDGTPMEPRLPKGITGWLAEALKD